MVLNFIWNIDPDIFSFGPFQLKWVTLLLVAGLLAGRKIIFFLSRREGSSLTDAGSVFLFSLLGAIIGARLFYVAFIEPDILFNRPLQIFFPFEFNRGFRFTGGSQFSMVGALAGVIIGLWIYARLRSKLFLTVLKKGLFMLMVLVIFARIGNLFQSEYFGKPTDSPTGILFVNKIEKGLLKLPCCAMRNPGGENPLDTVKVKPGKEMLHKNIGYSPLLIYLFFKDGATEQLVNEFLIGDVKTYLFDLSDIMFEPGTEPLHYTIFVEGVDHYMARIQTIGIARHPLQLYEGIAFLVLFTIMFLYVKSKNTEQQEGSVAGVLIMAISGIHFLIEFLNVLSRPLIKSIPLTIDQYLCIPLFLLGAVLLIISQKTRQI